MKKYKFILFFLLFITIFISCSKKNIPQVVEPDPLYNEAISLYNRGKYEKASEKFLEFKNRFPFDKRILEVEIKYCDSLYKAEKYIEAENAYLEFIKLHPKNKLVPYAYYQLGMIQYKQISTIDRDQSKLHEALKYFSYLIKRFPRSRFVTVALHRIHECKRKIAKNNFYIGYFYFKQERYKASIARFEKILRLYPGFIDDKVMYYLGKSYIDIGKKDKGINILKQLVKIYPASRYTYRAKKLIKHPVKDRFNLWARIKEYYFMDEEDVNDKYYSPGRKEFAYPPSSSFAYDLKLLSEKKRTLVTLKTSETIKKEYKKSEDISREEGEENKIPVNVSANEVDYLDNGQKVVFQGGVVVTREDLVIKCDKLIAYLNKKNKNIYKVEAIDGVELYYLTKEGRADRIVYYVPENKITMYGNPVLKDGNSIVTGKEIIYFVSTQKVFVMGGNNKRGKIIIEGK